MYHALKNLTSKGAVMNTQIFSATGCILIKPTLSVSDSAGKDTVIIDIYHIDTGYLYGIRAKLPPRSYQYQPHPSDIPCASEIQAKQKARELFIKWCAANNLKKRGAQFYNVFHQPELFPI